MKELKLNLGTEDTQRVVACIKGIAGSVSADDIVEIIIKAAEAEEGSTQKQTAVTMSSKEVAEIFAKQHTVVFKQISGFLCSKATEQDKKEFRLTSFKIQQGQTYPMYELTEKACNLYYDLLKSRTNYKTVAVGLERYKQAIQERFHPAKKLSSFPIGLIGSGFLLEGKPRKEYEPYCNVFNQFITGPACEGREITELTEKYQAFYKVMQDFQLTAKDSNRMETAMYDVAIEAEMQGFIYGFKLFDAILNMKPQVA